MSYERVLPGSVILILGDGQLAKMSADAASNLGYKVAVLGPGGRESPAGHVAYWAQAWGPGAEVSEDLLDALCSIQPAVGTLDWENVPSTLVERIEARGIPMRPGPHVLRVAQDRLLEKACAARCGISVAPFCNIEVYAIGRRSGFQYAPYDSVLKTRRNGYDGQGQIRISSGDSVEDAWRALSCVPCVLEKVIDFECEISVIIAQSPYTGAVTYGPFENMHQDGILRVTNFPVQNLYVQAHPEIKNAAIMAARKLACHLDVHGLLAVEFFVTKDGQVLFNEMAPRPHNSGHLTIECFNVSQFEALIRAICLMPHGSTCHHRCGEMRNLIAFEASELTEEFPSQRDCALHLYGKDEVREGRKMGHVTWHWPL